MQSLPEQERDEPGRVPALRCVPVCLQFLRFAHLVEAFPAESHDPREALERVPVMDMALLVRDHGALLQFGELVKRVTELDSAP